MSLPMQFEIKDHSQKLNLICYFHFILIIMSLTTNLYQIPPNVTETITFLLCVVCAVFVLVLPPARHIQNAAAARWS